MIISISGKAGSGKDTAAEIIKRLDTGYRSRFSALVGLDVRFNWEIKKWAGPLRQIASILLGFPEKYLYTTEFKESTLPGCWSYMKQMSENEPGNVDGWARMPMTGREFLQKLGTDAIRDGLHKNAWVNALMWQYRPGVDNWIITDTRFPNELEAVKSTNQCVSIRINRYPQFVDQDAFDAWRAQQHESETALDYAEFDYVIDNNGTIEDLTIKLEKIVYGIISAQQTASPFR